MRVGQSCFQQKSTNKPFSNLTSILTNPKVSSNVADPQRKHFSLQRINTFLLTLMKTKQAIASSGVTKTITCYPACSLALKSIQELDGAQVKDSILIILCNYIAELQEEACRFKQSLLDQTNSLCTQKAFNKEEIGQLTNLVLSELMEKLKNKLKQGFSKKQVYGLIHFKWTNQLVKKFIDLLDHPYQSLSQQKTEIERLYSSSFHKRQIYQKNNPNHKSSLRYEQMATNELFGHIENEKVSLLLQREFEMLSNKLKNKDLQCRNLHSQINEFAEIIKRQIDCLNENQAENQALKDYILLSSSQAESLNKKCRFLEEQLHKLEQEVQKQKPSLPNEQTYYVNPLWQKQQLQQKYLVELIQLQSDLLLQKDQVKALVDLALQQIKISHQVLYDLRASKFMICRFDQEVSKLLKGVTAFDKVNLEQHLILRQEGAYSESSPQMHKSTISTFSQVDTESKMRSQKQIMLFENLQQEYKQQ